MDHCMRQYRQRLEWMSSGSRRAIGSLLKARVCVILNLTQTDGRAAIVYKQVMERVIHDQVAGLEAVNVIV
jgi:hypothetical protein